MYEGALTSMKLGVSESVEFAVKVGVHQGSVLSPLLFIIILEALSKKFRIGLPWELFYADDGGKTVWSKRGSKLTWERPK